MANSNWNLPDDVTPAMIDALYEEDPPPCRICDDEGDKLCAECQEGYDEDATEAKYEMRREMREDDADT